MEKMINIVKSKSNSKHTQTVLWLSHQPTTSDELEFALRPIEYDLFRPVGEIKVIEVSAIHRAFNKGDTERMLSMLRTGNIDYIIRSNTEYKWSNHRLIPKHTVNIIHVCMED